MNTFLSSNFSHSYSTDEFYMQQCIILAQKGRGHTKTNPLTGCVIVKDGKVLAEGYHRAFGELHAERDAILQARKKNISLAGSTLYVNLEPCTHYGKQPPCVPLIVKEKISRVVIGMVDPNPQVCEKGIAQLKEAGVDVSVGILEQECRRLNAPFLHWIETGIPYCMGKVALSLDGKIATSTGQSMWITGEESRQHAHRLRSLVDGILVGVDTVIADNPSLTARFGPAPKDPIRIVADSRLRIPIDAKILHLASSAPTILLTTSHGDREKRRYLESLPHVRVLVCKEKDNRVDFSHGLRQLAGQHINTLLVEGGAAIHGTFLREGYFQKMFFYLAPKILGEGGKNFCSSFDVPQLKDSPYLKNAVCTPLGCDILWEGELCLPASLKK